MSTPSRSTRDRRSGGESEPFLQQLLQGWDPSASGTSRKPVECLLVGASELSTTDTHVYNLEVAEDHTYFAGGILVHNCDVLASQDLDGLGPGGYLPESVPSTPHPNDLCSQVAIIDENHFKRERAKLRGTKEPGKPWLSGKKQNGQAWLKTQPEGFQRKLLGPTRLAAFKRGARVLDKTGVPIPVHKVTGQPKPARTLGPAVAAKPLVAADRARMVLPFEKVPPSRR